MSAPWKVPREERWRQPKLPRAKRRALETERREAAKKIAPVPPPSITEQSFIQYLEDAMKWAAPLKRNVVWVSGGGAVWTTSEERDPGPRADGFDPDDAWLLCGACNEEWWFDPVPYGQYAVAPCGHYFLEHMTDIVAAFAGHVKPKGKANYRTVMEPPQ